MTEETNQQLDLAWAEAVEWTARRLNLKTMTPKRAGSKLRYNVWKAAKDEPKDFWSRHLPLAFKIKNEATALDTDIEVAEAPGVAELERWLESAIAESQK